jgi:hypothetical protein
VGPCLDLLMIYGPRFSAYCGLTHATSLGIDSQAHAARWRAQHQTGCEEEGRKSGFA